MVTTNMSEVFQKSPNAESNNNSKTIMRLASSPKQRRARKIRRETTVMTSSLDQHNSDQLLSPPSPVINVNIYPSFLPLPDLTQTDDTGGLIQTHGDNDSSYPGCSSSDNGDCNGFPTLLQISATAPIRSHSNPNPTAGTDRVANYCSSDQRSLSADFDRDNEQYRTLQAGKSLSASIADKPVFRSSISRRDKFQTTVRRKDAKSVGHSPSSASVDVDDVIGGNMIRWCGAGVGAVGDKSRQSLYANDGSSSDSDGPASSGVTSLSLNDGDSADENESVVHESTDPRDSLFKIVEELVASEERYVSRLDILVMVKNKTASIISPEVAKSMFPNIDIIQQFHRDSFSQQLKERINKWHCNKRIGDIMVMCAPFLKIYTDYVTNLKTATALVDTWAEKSKKFAAFVKYIKDCTEFDRLTLQAYMLEPIQRVPRYELLLREYLKKLPGDSEDRPDACRALEMVSDVASHFESMLQRDAHMSELMQVQRQIIGTKINVVNHDRCLIRRTDVTIIHSTGKRLERYAFLFNDLLLICVERPLVAKYQVKYEFHLQQSQVRPGNNLAIPNTLIISCHNKAVELSFSSAEESRQWEQQLRKQVKELTKKNLREQSTKAPTTTEVEPDVKTTRYAAYGFGETAPVIVDKDSVKLCHQCEWELRPESSHKHHCRACGHIFCGKCSSHLSVLAYCRDRVQRVCDGCFIILQEAQDASGRQRTSDTLSRLPSTTDTALEQGYLQISADGGASWVRRWFTVSVSGFLSTFKNEQDIIPMASINIDGYSVYTAHLDLPQSHAIALTASSKFYLLHDDDQSIVQRWLDVLTCVVYPTAKSTLV